MAAAQNFVYEHLSSGRAPELDEVNPRRHPLVVVGAGPVGLALAIDLAQRGQRVLLLDEDHSVSTGSRGLCYAKRTLEILDRLGCGDAVVAKGVTWNVGRTFFDTDEVFRFNLVEGAGQERPGMVNLQQYYLEAFLLKRARALPQIELRFGHRVIAVQPQQDAVQVRVHTGDGEFSLVADWLVAADGARSPLRRMLGLEVQGQVFQDRFLIADVVMQAGFPAERWFWFDPPFHRGGSVLLHRQADDVWRIDFQLGWDADPEEERKAERVVPRICAMLGPEHKFELAWVSVYTFQCRRMPSFEHGRVLFIGDAAHQVSPFGARGANSGVQDADNLGWKLKAVLDGLATPVLLQSYTQERGEAADENIRHSTRSTDFITPKGEASLMLRKAVLDLARKHPFARALVNSGRLSVPSRYSASPLSSVDAPEDRFEGGLLPGAPAEDAPLRRADGSATWLLRELNAAMARQPAAFMLLFFGPVPAGFVQALSEAAAPPCAVLGLQAAGPGSAAQAAQPGLHDSEGLAAQRFDARPGSAYLLRPDQHLAARWRQPSPAAVVAAMRRALALPTVAPTS
jgi:3-(3-hydroxy-phenyl)propionate hydroxylase